MTSTLRLLFYFFFFSSLQWRLAYRKWVIKSILNCHFYHHACEKYKEKKHKKLFNSGLLSKDSLQEQLVYLQLQQTVCSHNFMFTWYVAVSQWEHTMRLLCNKLKNVFIPSDVYYVQILLAFCLYWTGSAEEKQGGDDVQQRHQTEPMWRGLSLDSWCVHILLGESSGRPVYLSSISWDENFGILSLAKTGQVKE